MTLWLIGLLMPFVWMGQVMFGDPDPVEVSSETTFLTGKQQDDGSLDFSAALGKRCNAPIKASENAGVPLSQIPVLVTSSERHRSMILSKRKGRESLEMPKTEFFELRSETWDSQQLPWTETEHPSLGELVRREAVYADPWKAAMSRPRLVKPYGVYVESLTHTLITGKDILLRRAMLAAGEKRWGDAVDDLRSVDNAAELLAQLQCGWKITSAMQIRSSVDVAVTNTVLASDEVDPVLADFIRQRAKWPIHDVLSNALDNGIRIQFQLAVRDLRQSESRLRRLIRHGLVGKNEHAIQLQLNRVRNSINWTTMSRQQNEDLDAFLAAMQQPESDRWWKTYRTARGKFLDRPHGDLVASVRKLQLLQITEEIGYVVSRSSQSKYVAPLLSARRIAEQHRQMTLAALAMSVYRQEHGIFPAQLEDLPQEFHAHVLRHFASGRPYEYLRFDNGTGFEIGDPKSPLLIYRPEEEVHQN